MTLTEAQRQAMELFAQQLVEKSDDSEGPDRLLRLRSRSRMLPLPTLYSYCLRYDDGAAPNPYHGCCTLAICKPAIRRVAERGDWVVGLGGSHSPIGDVGGHVVYAMRVTRVLSLREYDLFCRRQLKGKIPKWSSDDFVNRVGDCIYDFSKSSEPRLRPSVHTAANRRVDLSGKNVLVSKHFYYFGDTPMRLPPHLLPIVHQTQGHKSQANQRYVGAFVDWITGLALRPNHLYGEPQLRSQFTTDANAFGQCSARHLEGDSGDAICQ